MSSLPGRIWVAGEGLVITVSLASEQRMSYDERTAFQLSSIVPETLKATTALEVYLWTRYDGSRPELFLTCNGSANCRILCLRCFGLAHGVRSGILWTCRTV